MIYVDIFFATILSIATLCCVIVGFKKEGSEALLWIAAALTFSNEALSVGKDIKDYYETQQPVKEIRV